MAHWLIYYKCQYLNDWILGYSGKTKSVYDYTMGINSGSWESLYPERWIGIISRELK